YFVSAMMNNGSVVNVKFLKLKRLIDKFALEKERYGLQDGDRVLLMTPVIADAYLSTIILSANHLTVVLADAGVPKAELLELIESTKVSAIFTDVKRFPIVSEYKKVPIFQTYSLNRSFSLLQEAEERCEKYEPTLDTMAIIFSSGTTSRMKAIQLSYDAVIASTERNWEIMDLNSKQVHKPCLMVFPMNHISGFACASGMFLKGLRVATVETVSSAALVGAIKIFEPVEFGMVPKVLAIFIDKLEEELKNRKMYGMYKSFRGISGFFRKKLGIRGVGRFIMKPFRKALFGKNMYTVLSGGAPCIPEVTSAMLDLGINYIVNYSSTECGVPILETDKKINDCLDCVGNVKSDKNVEIRINNPDGNGVGEIYVKSRYTMIGYYGEPEKTKDAFDCEWFKTGDNGYIDDKGYLHIAGRSKDSIMLSSGKKIAPDDLENLLLPVIGLDIPFSVVGVPDDEAGSDKIYTFVEGEYTAEEQKEIKDKIYKWQRAEAKLYPIEDVCFIKEFPKTSIGKVKRVKLRELVQEQAADKENVTSGEAAKNSSDEILEGETLVDKDADVLSKVNEIVMHHAGLTEPLTGYEYLIDELGIDSLTMMEICTEIESQFGVFIGTYLKVLPNTIEIAEYIKDPIFVSKSDNKKMVDLKFNAFEFPKQRKWIHRYAFKKVGNWFFKHLDVEIIGLENIDPKESYIFCPNHQTHVDGLWVWTAMGDKRPPIDSIGCMAKMEHLDTAQTRFMLTTLGGIPVDRTGNTMDSFKRSIDFIREGNSFLIHPEGTRSRDGKLGPFKSGAASMAIESETDLIPVTLDGGLDIWSYDMKKPKPKDKGGKKKHLRIIFGKPISYMAGDAEEITELLRNDIAMNLGEK
ncbi:MAG: AMP-binding protein, partial [Eubacterium sp.]|nr:AMP-binding protein [Eubacterium sp.]